MQCIDTKYNVAIYFFFAYAVQYIRGLHLGGGPPLGYTPLEPPFNSHLGFFFNSEFSKCAECLLSLVFVYFKERVKNTIYAPVC